MKKVLLTLLVLCAACVVFLIQQTNSLRTVRFTWESDRVPQGFDGFRVALVSDLHNKRFGRDQRRLVRAIEALRPDLIAVAGDLIDLHTKDLTAVTELLEGVKGLAPIYFADGNHDPTSPFYEDLHGLLRQHGVTALNGYTQLERGGDTMGLAGFSYWDISYANRAADIVLYHSPEGFSRLAALGCGLVLAGHNHGGQIALPGGRAIVGPAGGFFPRYSGGVYREDGSVMVLSRGLGASYIPFRAFARPEVVGVTLASIFD